MYDLNYYKYMKLGDIEDKMWCGKIPDWLGHRDHISSIPDTDSFVFYPYTEEEIHEESLRRKCKEHGYTLIKKPKSESEYRSGAHQAYKVLILEPNYDMKKIDESCGLIAEYYYAFAKKQGLDNFEK